MKIITFSLVLSGVACLVFCRSSEAASQDEVLRYRSSTDDPGHVENCGPANMNITWLPKELDPHGSVTFDGSFVFPVDFDQGTLDVDLRLSGMELRNTFAIQCAYLQKAIPTVTCPARKNQVVKGSYTITNLSTLSRYPGGMEAVLKAYNSNKEEVFCAKVKTVIKACNFLIQYEKVNYTI